MSFDDRTAEDRFAQDARDRARTGRGYGHDGWYAPGEPFRPVVLAGSVEHDPRGEALDRLSGLEAAGRYVEAASVRVPGCGYELPGEFETRRLEEAFAPDGGGPYLPSSVRRPPRRGLRRRR